HSGWLTAVATAITLGSLAMVALWRLGPEGKRLADSMWQALGKVDKWSLAGARYVAIMAASWLVAVPLASAFGWMAASPPGRMLARIGRGGLLAFVACVMLSVLGDAVAGALPRTIPFRLAVDLWTIAILWLCSDLWLTLRERRHPARR
ncbi:MAG TPA: succinyl transferase OpgC, partial [Paracoccus sp.]|nr:succinyl transferase OpgC [Paracoccus sp. (in: a-proteobacteria)]